MSTWYARTWTCHAATTVMVDDPTVITGRRVVAECDSVGTAHLVAAAPELLAALRAAERVFLRTYLPGSSETVDAVRAAIAKASPIQPSPAGTEPPAIG